MNKVNEINNNAVCLVEKKRKKLQRGVRLINLIALIVGILCLSLSVQEKIPGNVFIYGSMVLVLAAVLNSKRIKQVYLKFYKHHLITAHLKRILPQFDYKPFEVIDRADFCKSPLFKQDPIFSGYNGGDLIFNKTISFSELDVIRRHGRSSSTSRVISWPIFQGVFLKAKLPSSVSNGLTLSNKECGLINKKTLKRFRTSDPGQRSAKLTTGNQWFDDTFIIESQDPAMARFLCPEAIALITSLCQKMSENHKNLLPISIVFCNDQIHIAIGGVKLFDTKIKQRTRDSLGQLNDSVEFIQNLLALVALWIEL